jgi:tRNA A-37 threonylcarbamoyl transferase component Bud32
VADRKDLDKLAESIADGDSINWDELELAVDDELRQLLLHLRVVAGISNLHRSQSDDVSAPKDDFDRTPGSDPPTGRGVGVTPALRPASQSSAEGLGKWGHLVLLRKIGEGAFGQVYQAHDMWLDHPVALKLLRPEVASRVSPSRILQEARKLARVRHPNIVTVHGADRHEGQVGFWMDFVEGHTLEERVAEGRLSAGEATHIGQEVCRALTAVHHAKLIHRDVKAQNVMRASDGGRIILMDFGAGEFLDRPSIGSAQGTPLYLAPELFTNPTASVRTDIYAVGVLLYYLVSGVFPVEGSSVAALAEAHRRGQRRHLRDVCPDLPDAFVTIVQRALDPDPARRYSSAGEMYAALTAVPRAVIEPAPHHGDARTKDAHQTPAQYLGRVALVAMAAFAAAGLLGFVASRAFDVVLRIDPDFAAGPATYLSVGTRALFPFVVYWFGGAAVLGVVSLAFHTRLGTVWQRWTMWSQSLDPTAVAVAIFLAGAACSVAITWAFFDLFSTLSALQEEPFSPSVDVSALSPASRDIHVAHFAYSTFLSFILAVAAWRWFPQLEKRSEDASTIRLIMGATVAVALLVIAAAVVPRRFVWERFELVTFEGIPSLVIGANREELLLYDADSPERTRRRIRKDAPSLQRSGITRKLFDRPAKDRHARRPAA